MLLSLKSIYIRTKNHTRQMNIDYSICNALKYQSFGLPQSLVIYDIGCQWIINFLKRLKMSSHLSISDTMELLVAVGKFHLSAHIRECFVFYSLNFIYGSGQIDGEILETLWSQFNFISAPARTMSMAGRHQLYDDHMRDSNWKKIVAIGQSHFNLHGPEVKYCLSFLVPTLCKKFEKATIGVKETSEAFHELSAALDRNLVKNWRKEEQNAQVKRGEALRIYDVHLEQGIESSVIIRLVD